MPQYSGHGTYYYVDHKYQTERWGAYKTPKALKNKYKEIFPCPNCGANVVATVMNQFVCPRCHKVVIMKNKSTETHHKR